MFALVRRLPLLEAVRELVDDEHVRSGFLDDAGGGLWLWVPRLLDLVGPRIHHVERSVSDAPPPSGARGPEYARDRRRRTDRLQDAPS
jgi:hypothetical protein